MCIIQHSSENCVSPLFSHFLCFNIQKDFLFPHFYMNVASVLD
uniref:Uncharacterized protein n=1 Tax=Anguilla anguilla TaxID=7936 RepID=A0A0E9U019_ANGAN